MHVCTGTIDIQCRVQVYIYILYAHLFTHTHISDVDFFSAERKCPNKDFGFEQCVNDSPWNKYTNVSV